MFLVRYQLKDFTHKFSYLKAFSFFLLTIYSVIEYNFYRITFFFVIYHEPPYSLEWALWNRLYRGFADKELLTQWH